MRVIVRYTLVLVACAGSVSARAEDRPGLIELWTRTTGQYGGASEKSRGRPVILDLDKVAMKEGELVDLQYRGARTFRYVSIAELIRRYAPPAVTDTALLHFSNGMAIPLPFRNQDALQRLNPMVVRAVQIDDKWTSELPPISRTDSFYFDVRPIRFQGNKVVVASAWHPALRAGSEQAFSPWRHADSLTGIEFVSDHAFMAQFDVDATVRDGATTYGQVCRFCHGARRAGAQFGWDFVEPIPISEYRKKDVNLYYHVKYRSADSVSRGLLMPALSFLTEKDATDLLAWSRALAAKPLHTYTVNP